MGAEIQQHITYAVQGGEGMSNGASLHNYAYACTRVRAKKTRMLKDDDYMRLASMDLDSVARYMGESEYREEIAELARDISGVNLIEGATDMNLASTYLNVMKLFNGNDRAMLGYYLNELELHNLKTIIRGKFRNVDNDDIMSNLIPGGDFTGRYLNLWKAASDIPELLRALEGTRYHKDLTLAIGPDPYIKSTASIEDTLDKRYYAHVLDSIRDMGSGTKLFRSFIKREIDIRNVITLLRVKFAFDTEKVELSPDLIFIPGGQELDVDVLKRLYAITNRRQLLSDLEKYSFGYIISEKSGEALEVDRPTDIITSLEAHHRKSTGSFATRNPLSILPVIHYLMLKKNEVFNLRLIARGKERGLSPDKIRELIIT